VLRRQGKQEGGFSTLPSVTETEGQGESRSAGVKIAQGRLLVLGEDFQRRGVIAEANDAPPGLLVTG
jgi:hypothetical protein